jgi:hypothetical protein
MKSIIGWLGERLDFVIAILVAIATLVAVQLGFIKSDSIPIATLAFLIGLAIYLAIDSFQNRRQLDSIRRSITVTESKVASMSAVKVIRGSEQFYRSITSLISEGARFESTSLSSIAPTELTGSAGQEVKKYQRALYAMLKRSSGFRYRRIVAIPTVRKLQWLISTIVDSNKAPNYHIASLGTALPFPVMNMLIVNDEHLFLWAGGHQLSTETLYVHIEDFETVKVARSYYEELWKSSPKIKEGSVVDERALDLLQETLSKRD